MSSRRARNHRPPCGVHAYFEPSVGECRNCEEACGRTPSRYQCDQYCKTTKFEEHSATTQIPVPDNVEWNKNINIILAAVFGTVGALVIIIVIIIIIYCFTCKGKRCRNTPDPESGDIELAQRDSDGADDNNRSATSPSDEPSQDDHVAAAKPEAQHLLQAAAPNVPAQPAGPSVHRQPSAIQNDRNNQKKARRTINRGPDFDVTRYPARCDQMETTQTESSRV